MLRSSSNTTPYCSEVVTSLMKNRESRDTLPGLPRSELACTRILDMSRSERLPPWDMVTMTSRASSAASSDPQTAFWEPSPFLTAVIRSQSLANPSLVTGSSPRLWRVPYWSTLLERPALAAHTALVAWRTLVSAILVRSTASPCLRPRLSLSAAGPTFPPSSSSDIPAPRAQSGVRGTVVDRELTHEARRQHPQGGGPAWRSQPLQKRARKRPRGGGGGGAAERRCPGRIAGEA
ncbi:hypothetical protein T484DRAFT_2027894 [Baffinella frigidus]|nr:hypothetical protein T484DRAFT_2027894 [Cryptophyta sp. CCMP2293]